MEGRRCIADTVDENLRLELILEVIEKIFRDIEKVLNYFPDLGKERVYLDICLRRTTNACQSLDGKTKIILMDEPSMGLSPLLEKFLEL